MYVTRSQCVTPFSTLRTGPNIHATTSLLTYEGQCELKDQNASDLQLSILLTQGNAKAVLRAYLKPIWSIGEERGWALEKRGSAHEKLNLAFHCSALS